MTKSLNCRDLLLFQVVSIKIELICVENRADYVNSHRKSRCMVLV